MLGMANAGQVLDLIGSRFANRAKSIWTSRIGLFRVLVQLGGLLLLSAGAWGLTRTWFPLPVTYPTGSPYSVFWDGFEAAQYLLAYSEIPFIVLGVFMGFALVSGRMTCGWVCPFGFFQDILSWFPLQKFRPAKPDNDFGNAIKYVVVVGFLAASSVVGIIRAGGNEGLVAGFRTDVAWSLFDPSGTLFATFYYYLSWGVYPANGSIFDAIADAGTYTIVRSVIFFFIILAAVKIPRFYCRYLCPTGAMLGLFADKSLVGIARDPLKCDAGCDECEKKCPMQVPIVSADGIQIQDRSCINCGVCVDACPSGALKYNLRIAS